MLLVQMCLETRKVGLELVWKHIYVGLTFSQRWCYLSGYMSNVLQSGESQPTFTKLHRVLSQKIELFKDKNKHQNCSDH